LARPLHNKVKEQIKIVYGSGMMNSQNDKEGSGHVKAAIIGGVFAVIAACIGGSFLILNTMVNNGVIVFGASNPSSQNTQPTNTAPVNQEPTAISSNPTSIPVVEATTIPTETAVKYDGWVICWHGRDSYEYLIAYPQSQAEQGINLNIGLTNAQGQKIEVPNDSLKMCYVDGEWYGYPDPNEWFPKVSYFKLIDKEILVCSDSPNCQGEQHTIYAQGYYAWNAPELQAPKEAGIHIIDYKSSK
jgi:hypothetical protein